MNLLSVLSFSHHLLMQCIHPGDTVIDATLGKGADTLLLAKLVGEKGCVYGFDVQQQALDLTMLRLEQEFPDAASFVRLSLCNHALMARAIPIDHIGTVAAVTFNLGYLPGGERDVTTTEASTLPALHTALQFLRPGGLVTIVLYTGHHGGAQEAQAVETWAQQLPQNEYEVLRYQFANQQNHPPYLLAIEKKAGNTSKRKAGII
ncbi:tRNA (mnm(5)s(2)U34)-methyltransferase [Paenibacillus eucommiae]|uniref:Methyltransferase n=1 Tax=Paenibacillus eucommiae TaxID=1355755 RepID=A0ABS4J459_9BACL|nr:class I SAM-dependent methyltransferase [Paenibacillus eucommiae]MBP1993881.1 putative methyltransferase [Paenibacillus eucommiae]